jgi:hypothetical protein
VARGEKLWKRLNEPLTIWALSTVVVGIFGTAYSELNSRLLTEREQKREIARLENQAAVRLEYAGELAKGPTDSRLLLDTLLMDTPETRLNQDFEGRTTIALLFELQQLCGLCGTNQDHGRKTMELVAEAMLLRSRLIQEPGQIRDESISARVRSIIKELLSL